MRTCAKMRCSADPVAGAVLDYAAREIWIGDLTPERDPTVLDLCDEHATGVTPPIGWTVHDRRSAGAASVS